MRDFKITTEAWPLAGTFTISRGSRTESHVVLVEISEKGHAGHGECVPYPRYGESVASVMAQIEAVRDQIRAGWNRTDLMHGMKAGAARNAVDAALIDLECKLSGKRAWDLLGLAKPAPKATCYTISLGTPDAMGASAATAADRPLLKLKLGHADQDIARVEAVRAAAPRAQLVVDANEGWSIDDLARIAPRLAELGVAMIEQPLPAASDGALAGFRSAVPLCADESAHVLDDLEGLANRYQIINIKLDKTGGLTAALDVAREAKRRKLGLMIGCMIGTSLSMAPGAMLMDLVQFVDLDAPLLLAKDRSPGLHFDNSLVHLPEPGLWG